jgi:iron complex outermembrane recepter protein
MISRLVGAALLVLIVCLARPAFAQDRAFDIPEQPATAGIPAFAKQAGIQIIAPATELGDKKTHAVLGTFSVDAALAQLLRGTGLQVASRNGNVVSLSVTAPPASAPPTPRPTPPSPTTATDPPTNDASTTLQEIVVSGTHFRLSPSPQKEKENSIATVSTVGSEELAERTDSSVVAALERLPGVVRQRGTDTSQAWYPAIRGFSAMYNSVTLDDGMLYLSTRNQRGVPLDFIPTAVVNEIVVYKTVTPEMDPNSIGGHIDVRTLRSFDNDGNPLTKIDVQGEKYSQAGALHDGKPSFNINGVIKRTFGVDNNFGFVLAGSTHQDKYNERQNLTTTFTQSGGADIPSGNLETGNYNSSAHGSSLMGKLEGRGEGWYGYLGSNYFQEQIWRDLYRSNVSIVPADVTDATDGTGSFTGATPSALSNSYYNDRHIFSVRGGLEYQTNDTSKIVFNSSYLKANFREGLWTGANLKGPTVSGNYDISDTSAATSISGPASLTNPAQWVQASGATASQIEYPLMTNIVTTRVEYKSNDFGFSHGLGYDFGIDFRQMWRQLSQYENDYTLAPGTTINLSQVLVGGSAFNGTNPSQPIYVDTTKYWNLVSALGNHTYSVPLTTDYDLSEAVIGPFAGLYYTTDKFRFITGARYNITHYTDSTHTITDGVTTPFNITRTLPYFLPNVQGYYNFAEGLRLRAAYTETIALQNYSAYLEGTTTNNDAKGNPYTQGSNPYLEPRLSYNEDLSLEWYVHEGYVSFGYFHKTIKNEVQGITQYKYDSAGNVISYSQTPVNAGGEHSQGLELESEWRDFTGIAPWLRGLTVDANGSWYDSDTEALVGAGVERRVDALAQQPKWIANLILTYDHGPYSASLIGQARGKAFSSFAATSALDIWIAPYQTLDARLGYEPFRGCKLYVEGRNLTNYWYKEVYGMHSDLVSTAIRSGPIYVIGATYQF